MSVNRDSLSSYNWRLVMDAMPEGITIHSSGGEIQHANKGILDIYGASLGELVGRSCEDVFHDGSPGCPHREVMESRKGASIEARHGLAGKLYSVTLDPIIDQGGELQGFIRIMRDISERQKAQEQLIKAERFATLGQMISGIAHDVGTPLNIISGYSEYLLVRTKPDGQGYKELSTILQQTRRIADFIKQMLDLSRPGQGRSDPIGLKGFFTESLDLMSHHFRKSNVKANLTCDGNLPLVYGDAPRLRQAFFNLFLNVFQRTGPGSRLEIIINEPDGGGGHVKITIKGTEASGEAHDFSESFSAFLNPSKGDSILGMGLSLAKEILNESGARVEALGTGESGVPLVIILPIRKAEISAG
ncbi:MAG TPA: histidine kinase dimerization/phospho-acceptor domain-containing protein [Blastocatellia bacterium]|nr:histidine kinase dimerization/phospho-acceptor domain-containing protein [Blastocatellia bacterium]